MSNRKKVMICIFVCVEIYLIFAFAFKYKAMLYLTVYGDELIKNVFDEIYYSEMHPAFFKYTGTDLRNLKGIIWPDDPFYSGGSRVIRYSTRDSSDTMYKIEFYNSPHNWDAVLVIYKKSDDYKTTYHYYYDVEQKVVTYCFSVYSYDKNGKEVDREDDIDVFFEETGLSYDYLRTHQQLELDKFLDIWFEKNEGLSRFSPDNLGDFTIVCEKPYE